MAESSPVEGSSFFHQQWPINGGTLMIQIRTSRVLIGPEYEELGKVISEVERLAGMLSWVEPEQAEAPA